jgi:hypothetical protein
MLFNGTRVPEHIHGARVAALCYLMLGAMLYCAVTVYTVLWSHPHLQANSSMQQPMPEGLVCITPSSTLL